MKPIAEQWKDHVREKQAEEISSEEIGELKKWVAQVPPTTSYGRVPKEKMRTIYKLIDFFELNRPEAPASPTLDEGAKRHGAKVERVPSPHNTDAHPISRTSSCPMCRAGWNLSYGTHTTRRASGGTAWCEWCKSWVKYKDECFTVHRNRKRQRCPGSGKMIPGY